MKQIIYDVFSRFAMHSMLSGKDYMVQKTTIPHIQMMFIQLNLMKKEAAVLMESKDEPVMAQIKIGFGAKRMTRSLDRSFQMQ